MFILGGLSHAEEDSEKLTNPEFRKARFDLLYKEYEVIQLIPVHLLWNIIVSPSILNII